MGKRVCTVLHSPPHTPWWELELGTREERRTAQKQRTSALSQEWLLRRRRRGSKEAGSQLQRFLSPPWLECAAALLVQHSLYWGLAVVRRESQALFRILQLPSVSTILRGFAEAPPQAATRRGGKKPNLCVYFSPHPRDGLLRIPANVKSLCKGLTVRILSCKQIQRVALWACVFLRRVTRGNGEGTAG